MFRKLNPPGKRVHIRELVVQNAASNYAMPGREDKMKYQQDIREKLVGTNLLDAPLPSAVIDRAKVQQNCDDMLKAVDLLNDHTDLKWLWRAHIKTHKTWEGTEWQVGTANERECRIVVSTLKELEEIHPVLVQYHQQLRKCDILYGFPLHAAAVDRLCAFGAELGLGNLSVLIDNVAQLQYVLQIQERCAALRMEDPNVHRNEKKEFFPQVNVYVKANVGTERAGVTMCSTEWFDLSKAMMTPKNGPNPYKFQGFYAHAGHSYAGNSRGDALHCLNQELASLLSFVEHFDSRLEEERGQQFILSVGATPTTTSVFNLLKPDVETEGMNETEARYYNTTLNTVRETLRKIKEKNCVIELHAGVYATLDVQQLATHAVANQRLNWDRLALTILTQVVSVYPQRSEPEALILGGSLALGREACKAYGGFGIVSNWNTPGVGPVTGRVEDYGGWYVYKLSQEHGILRCVRDRPPVTIGQRLRIWPNHACIAGAGFEYYLVVDSSIDENVVVDVWFRMNGWN